MSVGWFVTIIFIISCTISNMYNSKIVLWWYDQKLHGFCKIKFNFSAYETVSSTIFFHMEICPSVQFSHQTTWSKVLNSKLKKFASFRQTFKICKSFITNFSLFLLFFSSNECNFGSRVLNMVSVALQLFRI